MARVYHIDIATFTSGAGAKWVDNLLSAYAIPGVQTKQRGVARTISTHGIQYITLVRRLSHDLGVSVDTAVSLSRRMLGASSSALGVSAHLELHLDRQAFEQDVARRIAEAVESIVPARRGRPPARTRSSSARG